MVIKGFSLSRAVRKNRTEYLFFLLEILKQVNKTLYYTCLDNIKNANQNPCKS